MSLKFTSQNPVQASVLISIFTIISQIFGMIRESVIASKLGTSVEYDSILIALALPAMVSAIFLMSLPSAGIPYLQAGTANRSNLGFLRSPFVTTNLLISLLASVVVFLIMPLAVELIAKGLDSGQKPTVIFFGRLFCMLIPIRALQAVFTSHLQANFHFIAPAYASIGFNLVIIVMLITLFPVLGAATYVPAMIMGTFAEMLLVMFPAYYLCRNRATESKTGDNSGAAFPVLLGGSILIETIWMAVDPFDRYVGGLYLEAGFVSAIYYAGMVSQMPFRMLVLSLGVAIFPALAEAARDGDRTKQAMLYHRAIGISAALLIPVTVFCLVFSRQIIELIFQRGRFDSFSTDITVKALKFYFAGLFFASAYFIQSRVYYAMKKLRELLGFRAISFAVKVMFALLFIDRNWALALAGGTVAMFIFSFVVMEAAIVYRHGLKYSREDLGFVLRSIMAGSTLSVVILLLAKVGEIVLPESKLILLAVVLILGTAAAVPIDSLFNISGIDLRRLMMSARRK